MALPQTITLKDGRAVLLRLARPTDAARLIAAIDSVAQELAFFLRSRFLFDIDLEREAIADAAERGNLFLLAEIEGTLVGWVTLFRRPQEFRAHAAEMGIGIIRDYRSLGIGTALLQATLEWARQDGLERVELGVRASNSRAHRLYLSLGFVDEGLLVDAVKDNEGRYDDEILMAHRL